MRNFVAKCLKADSLADLVVVAHIRKVVEPCPVVDHNHLVVDHNCLL